MAWILLSAKTVLDAYLSSFQFKILIVMLLLNEKLFNFEITNTIVWLFCNRFEETLVFMLRLSVLQLKAVIQIWIALSPLIPPPATIPEFSFIFYIFVFCMFVHSFCVFSFLYEYFALSLVLNTADNKLQFLPKRCDAVNMWRVKPVFHINWECLEDFAFVFCNM